MAALGVAVAVPGSSLPRTPAMKVYSLSIAHAPPSSPSTVLSSATDVSSFSFYQRGSVSEFLTFFSKTVVERTIQGQRQTVQENNYIAHVYNRGGAEQLAGATTFCLLSRHLIRVP